MEPIICVYTHFLIRMYMELFSFDYLNSGDSGFFQFIEDFSLKSAHKFQSI